MNIENFIKFETIEVDESIMQKCTLLTIFNLSVFVSYRKGTHFSFSCGLGPIETEFALRVWI